MTKKILQESRDMDCLKIVLLESDVYAHMFALGRYSERRKCRYSVMFVAVSNDRCLTFRSPRSTARWYEKEPTFIEECKMGAKSCGFFLCVTTCSSSNLLWPAHPVELVYAQEPDNSNRDHAGVSRCVLGGI